MVLSLHTIPQLLLTYKYALLFPISIVEGPVVTIIAGFLISGGYLNPYFVYGILIAGDLIGDTLYYMIGRFGGHFFIRRWGHIFGIDDIRLQKLEKNFENHGGKLLLFGKTQGLGSAILAAAGISKMPYGRFMWINLLGTVVKVFVFLIIGYYFGQAYTQIDSTLNKIVTMSSLILIVAIVLYILYRRKNI